MQLLELNKKQLSRSWQEKGVVLVLICDRESEQQQQAFRLDIRQEPIHEEAGDAQTAISNVTNALRAVSFPVLTMGT